MTGIGLDDFVGSWRLVREIEDHRLGQRGRFDGLASFVRVGGEVVQTERGVLRFGKADPMTATRVYRWREDTDGVAVHFEDGRSFHRFSPRHSDAAVHVCGNDTYKVTYGFENWPNWTSTWVVTGPRKDLLLRNEFVRAD